MIIISLATIHHYTSDPLNLFAHQPLSPLITTNVFYGFSASFTVFNIWHMSEIKCYLSSSIWLVSLIIRPLRPIHVSQMAKYYSFYGWVVFHWLYILQIPWRRERPPTSVFWPGEFHGMYSPRGHKESDTTEWLSLFTFTSSLSIHLLMDI